MPCAPSLIISSMKFNQQFHFVVSYVYEIYNSYVFALCNRIFKNLPINTHLINDGLPHKINTNLISQS